MNEKIKKSINLLKKFNKDLEPISCFLYNNDYVFNVTLNGEYTIGDNFYKVDLKNEIVSPFEVLLFDDKILNEFEKTSIKL